MYCNTTELFLWYAVFIDTWRAVLKSSEISLLTDVMVKQQKVIILYATGYYRVLR